MKQVFIIAVAKHWKTMAKRRNKKPKRPLTETQKRNLKPFTKNDPRINKNGRPRTKLPKLEDVLIKVLGVDEETGESEIENLVKEMLKQAKDKSNRNNTKAAGMLIERAYGKVPLVVQGPDGDNGKPQPIFGFNIKLKTDGPDNKESNT